MNFYFDTRFFRLITLALLTGLFCTQLQAERKITEFGTFTFENDLFVGDDDGYTNGFGLTYGKANFREFDNENLPGWLHWLTVDLYISTMRNKYRGVAHMFFQRLQTPEDLGETELITDDFPYAGLFAWQGTQYAWDSEVSDQFSTYLGVVGPIAMGEEMQELVHGVTGSDEPKGWENQLENEPVFKFEAQRVWKLHRTENPGLQFEVLGLAGAGFGTLETATKGGIALRWGTNLKSSFATFSLQADRQANPLALADNNDYYFFLGFRAGVVLNDILVDGNTFTDSHSLPLDHLSEQFSAGAVWTYDEYALVFQVSSSRSRTTALDDRETFAALSLTYRL